MSPTPKIETTVETPGASLDDQLRAWFDALVAQPVPEALLRHLDALAEAPAEPG